MPDAKFYMLSIFLISIISIFNDVNWGIAYIMYIGAPNEHKLG